MKRYTVTWAVRVEAENPIEAAKEAHQMARVNVDEEGFAFRIREDLVGCAAAMKLAGLRDDEQIVWLNPGECE